MSKTETKDELPDEALAVKSPAAQRDPPTWQLTRRIAFGTLVGGIALGGVGGYFLGRGGRRTRAPRPPMKPAYVPTVAHNPRQGAAEAKIIIVEFSDLQCPFCDRLAGTLRRVLEKFPTDVALFYKHRPLAFHKYARNAAMAMQAANRQNKAWPLHDRMFDNHRALEPANVRRYAEEVGLDIEKFDRDLTDATMLIRLVDMTQSVLPPSR